MVGLLIAALLVALGFIGYNQLVDTEPPADPPPSSTSADDEMLDAAPNNTAVEAVQTIDRVEDRLQNNLEQHQQQQNEAMEQLEN